MQPAHCAWVTLDADSCVKRTQQGLFADLLGHSYTYKAGEKLDTSVNEANEVKAALDLYNHPYAITQEQQLYDIVQYMWLDQEPPLLPAEACADPRAFAPHRCKLADLSPCTSCHERVL